MSWHYLQGQEAASWEGICLDGAPNALLKLTHTPEKCSCNDKRTDVCQGFRYGTTCEHSTGSRGTEESTLYQAGSPAPTLAEQTQTPKVLTETKAACGLKWRESSVRYDLATRSWRTHRSLWDEDLSGLSLTLPSWGMTLDGVCWEPTTQAPPTRESESGLWPTPCAQGNQTGGPVGLGGGSAARAKLLEMCENEQEAKAMGCGKLNPEFAEWLLGWPINWTSIEPQDCGESATGRFQQWRQWHGCF